MPLLIGWCWFAAVVLIVSFVVHASTFLGIDPLAKWPGLMLIHLAIFPPFIAAIIPIATGKAIPIHPIFMVPVLAQFCGAFGIRTWDGCSITNSRTGAPMFAICCRTGKYSS